jgi:hypothetical protein
MDFLNKIADVSIKALRMFKKILGQKDNEFMTPRGLLFPGIRLTGDAVVNLSPSMIEDVMCPIYAKFEKVFSNVMQHYCCLPAPSSHVIGALMRGGGIRCVDNWQGYKTLLPEAEYIQTKIGICTDITKDQIMNGTLLEEAFFHIRGRALTCSITAQTIDEGEELYHQFQKQMNGVK